MSQIKKHVITAVTVLAAVTVLVSTVQPISINGESMEPGLKNGQVAIINKTIRKKNIDKGEIIVFRTKNNGELIKRVIGTENDQVRIYNNAVFVNSKELNEPYVKDENAKYKSNGIWTVPPDSYFVMGDNRGNSLDSRSESIGMVHSKEIIGKLIHK